MSTTITTKACTVADIMAAKTRTEPLVCLTAYDQILASLADQVADLVLVGDSLAMVAYGHSSTLPVDLATMIQHGRAVANACQRALVVVDMPFGSYQSSPAQAFDSAARVLKETGAAGVKLEGGVVMAETVAFLVERGIPVLGHIGLQPQSVNATSGYRYQGRDAATAAKLLADAKAIAKAGAFALVVEAVEESVARAITNAIPIPTIGIGASVTCDGQILVSEDLLGWLGGGGPRFVKRYADLRSIAAEALQEFAEDVRQRRFPGSEHVYTAPSSTKITSLTRKPA
jgi:3-methyl-2-oxobutanoate hydroxymethyltransferase